MNAFNLRYPPGRLDLQLCLNSGQVFRWHKLPDGEWLGADGDHWFVVVPIAEGELCVRSNARPEDFEHFFRLDWDAEAVEREVLARGPEMAPYLTELKGLRLLRPSDPVETLYSFLCTPNNNLKRIVQMVRCLAAYGPLMAEVQGEGVHRFPGTETIASIPPLELRGKGFGYRGDTIPSVARQVIERGGDSWIRGLKNEAYQDAHDQLCEIKGIGPKLADCICLFALHQNLAVPIDTHIWQAAVRLYFPELKEKSLTGTRYRMIGDALRCRFGELTGWAHQYLFYDNLLNWRTRES